MIKLKRLFDSLLLSQATVNSDYIPLITVLKPWGLGTTLLFLFHDLLSKKTEAALSRQDIYKHKDGNTIVILMQLILS